MRRGEERRERRGEREEREKGGFGLPSGSLCAYNFPMYEDRGPIHMRTSISVSARARAFLRVHCVSMRGEKHTDERTGDGEICDSAQREREERSTISAMCREGRGRGGLVEQGREGVRA